MQFCEPFHHCVWLCNFWHGNLSIIDKLLLSLQGKFVSPENPIYLRAISYCILFIPLLIIASVYPLNVHPMVNNIYTVVLGHDTSKSPRNIRYRLLLLMLRFLVALIPILLAFGISNLVTVAQFTGLFAFLVIFFFPTVLQLQSIRVCKRRFRDVHVHIQMYIHVQQFCSAPSYLDKVSQGSVCSL